MAALNVRPPDRDFNRRAQALPAGHKFRREESAAHGHRWPTANPRRLEEHDFPTEEIEICVEFIEEVHAEDAIGPLTGRIGRRVDGGKAKIPAFQPANPHRGRGRHADRGSASDARDRSFSGNHVHAEALRSRSRQDVVETARVEQQVRLLTIDLHRGEELVAARQ